MTKTKTPTTSEARESKSAESNVRRLIPSFFYVRTPKQEICPGVRTFVIPAVYGPDNEYTLKYGSETRKWWCSCPDFFHRRSVLNDECKHVKLIKHFIREFGGMKRIARGVTCRIQNPRSGIGQPSSKKPSTTS